MNYMDKIKWILIGIVLVAGLLRFYQLGSIPPSLTWDEVAWGYNAYTLGIDGKDEFGRFLPYDYLESFGDFKPPVYAYLDIIPIKLFGLTEFAVRFPSAFFGTLTVLITFFLMQELFPKIEKRKRKYLGLIAAGILALSPWHIMLSRAAFEANIATFLIVTGVWLFLRSINGYKWSIVISALFFVLSLYTFNTPRIVVPILLLVLTIGFYKKLWFMKKQVIVAALLGLIVIAPTVRFLLSPQASLRFREVNIFSNLDVIERSNQEIQNDNNSLYSKIIYNRRLQYSIEYLKHYFDHFNPTYLFIHGDMNPKFSTQDIGQLYLWDLPFLLIGILVLFRKREGYWWLIPIWIVIGIIPAATARETPHALRTEATVPMFQILIAYGVYTLSAWLPKKKVTVIRGIIGVILAVNVFYFLYNYYTYYSNEYASEWQYGYKQAIAYVQKVQGEYRTIYISSYLGRPYIYYLFYLKLNPQTLRNDSKVTRDTYGFVTVSQVGKYHFLDSSPSPISGKNLYVDLKGKQSAGVNIRKSIDLKNERDTLIIYE